MNQDRIQAVLVATKTSNVIYERFYDSFSDEIKSDMRLACAEAASPILESAEDEFEFCSTYKKAALVGRLEGDVIFFALGTGEYEELTLAHALRAIVAGLRDNLKKQPGEALLFENYGKLVMVIDEVVDEGILAATDKETIARGLKMKALDEA